MQPKPITLAPFDSSMARFSSLNVAGSPFVEIGSGKILACTLAAVADGVDRDGPNEALFDGEARGKIHFVIIRKAHQKKNIDL